MTLAARVLDGDPRAIARAISLIENEDPAGVDLIRALFGHTGRAFLVGVTGPPGAGKSTLVDRLTAALRRPSLSGHPARTVGIIAVDPTSPFTGGAVLGDRLRMQSHAADAGVFIRSMATRGHLGGLARASADAALVLDAAGKEVVLLETVGVGQDEVEIVRTADLSIVTLVPGTGDEVQALKAGIMEIADIFVVNKADREGADRLAAAVEGVLALRGYGAAEWRPPVLKTIATDGRGVEELLEAIWRFRDYSTLSRTTRRRDRGAHRLRELVAQQFMQHLETRVLAPGELEGLVDRIAARELDPYTAAAGLLRRAVPDALRGATRPAREIAPAAERTGA
jgi:LAO/AO transport system kinase